MKFNLEGRKALVTGASGGLGEHFAKTLAEAGAAVVLTARRKDALEKVVETIAAAGGDAEAIPMDVADTNSVARAFERFQEPFDIVVNNAGVSGSGAAIDQAEDEFQRVIDTNLTGAFRVSQHAARAMKTANRPGAIINIASIVGLRVAGHVSAYAASKAALIQLTKATALEWARYRIRVNALCPGYIETPLNADFFASEAGQALVKRIPQRRLGRMEDLDGPLLLLCSDAGAYMTGATLAVDGGHLISSL
ncbi:glucose 1-dehydrogenase [Hoeflea sp. WL0058]|uniref:Glucose 1-dehydrogenase n=1 Tax=Flavimaribacter sediminis TaxID=2865987 RepID=A0AAE2ZKD1_9HYPH|nr:glucose 1-dehydrogenase [Flavimaribacter sediminis]